MGTDRNHVRLRVHRNIAVEREREREMFVFVQKNANARHNFTPFTDPFFFKILLSENN